ncbi:MAG: helix-hairpin-helix domain-containing protein [Planctomycetota bacterium]|nr:helix-hairpin-helix domain-containing protein [Planctomycetota bacterium]
MTCEADTPAWEGERAITKYKQSAPESHATNSELSAALLETANLLEAQGARPFRVQAYRNAAHTVDTLKAPLWHTREAEGAAGLVRLPTIGHSIAGSLAHMLIPRNSRLPLAFSTANFYSIQMFTIHVNLPR